MAQGRGGRLYGIDGLRGVAALVVMLYHATAHPRPALLPLGLTGVELFFVISGFVLAYAYEDALARGHGGARYLLQRFIRLYPVHLLATLFGFSVYVLDGAVRGGANPALQSALTLGKSLLLIPEMSAFPIDKGAYFENARLFPFDNPAWSLLIEVWCSALFLVWRPRGVWLGCTLIALGALLADCTVRINGIGGFNQQTFLAGLPRGMFCFYSGLGLYRLWQAGALRALPRSSVIAVAAVAAGSFCKLSLNVYLLVAFVAAPLMVALGTAEPRSPRVRRLFGWLGDISYPLYLLHLPLFALARLLADVAGLLPATEWPPRAASLAMAAVAVALAAACARLYDTPARRWLRAALISRRAERTLPPAGAAAIAP